MAFPTKMFSRKLTAEIRFSEDDKYDDIAQMHRLIAFANRVAYHGLPKYTFYRHNGNNSAWTTNHSLLTSKTLNEYLRVYRERTEWLSGLFPNSTAAWRYFEWSFMLSMIEKITRLGITGGERQYEAMARELAEHRWELLNCEWVLDFEKEWLVSISDSNFIH